MHSYLDTEHDLTVLERGMSILTRVMHTSPLADIIDHTESDKRLGQWLPTSNLADLRAYMRSHLETLYHPTSTARMAPLEDGGVVDPRLRVHGVRSLRVVDASVFPTIISGHTVRPRSPFALICRNLTETPISDPLRERTGWPNDGSSRESRGLDSGRLGGAQ
jgi:choline dehydrogenase-like flavoprotein